MRANLSILLPLLLSVLLIDLYTFYGLKPLLKKLKHTSVKRLLTFLFWGITAATFAGFTWFNLSIRNTKQADTYVYVGYLSAGFILFYFPKLIFILFVLLNDLRLLFKFLHNGLANRRSKTRSKAPTEKITRSAFIARLGLVVAALPFFTILHGITLGKTNYRLVNKKIAFTNLPQGFKGLKIIQISDIHLGSLNQNYQSLEEAVELINAQNADLLVFTGDIVNNFADETVGWAPILSKMKARMGKFAIMGNHDYGDYSRWTSAEEKARNLAGIKAFHEKAGFRLLLNETEILHQNGDSIALIGVENWGHPPFPQYGDLAKAAVAARRVPFKILLSHDPTHWEAEVLNHTNIDLTLAGHTHGMQFGLEKAGIKWSPIQYKSKRWGGLYHEGEQYLYINRGLGYLGFPGRIGMPPEITIIELE